MKFTMVNLSNIFCVITRPNLDSNYFGKNCIAKTVCQTQMTIFVLSAALIYANHLLNTSNSANLNRKRFALLMYL